MERLNTDRNRIVRYCLTCEVEEVYRARLQSHARMLSASARIPRPGVSRFTAIWDGLLYGVVVFPMALIGAWFFSVVFGGPIHLLLQWVGGDVAELSRYVIPSILFLTCAGFWVYAVRQYCTGSRATARGKSAFRLNPPNIEEIRTELLRTGDRRKREVAHFLSQLREQYVRETAGIDEVDTLTGVQFELLMADFFARRGFAVKTTGASGDMGVDLIIEGSETRIAVQCKRYGPRRMVGVDAVQAVAAGKQYYACETALVVSTTNFTRPAISMARQIQVDLWPRGRLVQELSKTRSTVTWDQYLNRHYERD